MRATIARVIMPHEVFAFCTTCTVALLGHRLDIVTTIAAFGTPEADLVTLAHQHTPRVSVVVGCWHLLKSNCL